VQSLTVHFLFNLALLIVLLFFCLMWAETSGGKRINKGMAKFYFVISLILCFVFSYQLNEEIILDLRIVPLIIGGLYMGLSPMLALVIIIIRGFHGIDLGFYLGVAFYGIFGFLLWYLSPWFLKLTSKYRILFSVGVTWMVGVLMVVGLEILDSPNHTLDVWFAYILIPPLGVAMISYIMEVIEKNILLRQRLVKAEKLDAVEQMGAAISHEIRNPLTSAMGFLQLLEDDLLNVEKRNQYLSIMKEELQSAEKVIQDYLTFSKPKLESIEVFEIQEQLNKIINLLQPSANKNSVKVISHYSSQNLIQGDCQKFHQCFVNILKNAIESMPNGGLLSITTLSNSSQVTIKVQDTGVGMTKEQIDRLGEPYYSTKGNNGTGLGVMVAHSIVRAMNGTVNVKSKVGVGTEFTFTFHLFSQNENNLSNQVSHNSIAD